MGGFPLGCALCNFNRVNGCLACAAKPPSYLTWVPPKDKIKELEDEIKGLKLVVEKYRRIIHDLTAKE